MWRNPLEAGQKFNSNQVVIMSFDTIVAIPLKRGKSSTRLDERNNANTERRNPLEAGQKFNGKKLQNRRLPSGVAIPLKRGKSSTELC